jgi:hypothetical protein
MSTHVSQQSTQQVVWQRELQATPTYEEKIAISTILWQKM